MKMTYIKNYYKILNVEKNCVTNDVKLSYRKLANIHHPDKGGNEETFKDIVEAYKVLINDEYRTKYDKESIFGANYDSSYDLYNFEFNQNTKYNEMNKNLDKFKKNELIDILLKVDKTKFTGDIKYERRIRCVDCNGTTKDIYSKSTCYVCIGVGTKEDKNGNISICYECNGDGDILNYDICDYCEGNGNINNETCPFCKGLCKIYANSCKTCAAKGTNDIIDEIKLDISDFNEDGKLLIKQMGNYSMNDGITGNLYIVLN